MPYYPPVTSPVIATNLVATGMLGLGVPKYAQGVANGVAMWLPTIAVATTDAGSLGTGVGVLPFALPQPLLLTSLTESFQSLGMFGVMAPLKILGLANGLAATLPSAVVQTTHPSVGTGTGLASFTSPPPMPMIQAGFAQAGLVGGTIPRVALAIGLGLQKAMIAFRVPVPIVGSASPSGSSGVGSGKIV
jgi:hypothetical protein